MANDHITINPTASAPRAQPLLNVIAQGIAFRNALIQYKASLPHYGAVADGDTGATALVTDFGLTNIGGKSLQNLIASCADEATGAAAGTFIAQLLDRCG